MKEIAAAQFYEDVKNILAAARGRACRANGEIRYAPRSELYRAYYRQSMRVSNPRSRGFVRGDD